MNNRTEAGVPAYDVVWPLGRSAVLHSTPNLPLQDLTGKTIAELWDYVFHGDRILAILREKLAARYPGIRFIPYEVFGNLHGAQQRQLLAKMPELLKEHGADAVISLVGA